MPSKPRRAIGSLNAALSAAALALTFAGCATNPATGQRQISFVSTGKEAAMGRESDPAIIEQYGLYGDSAVAHYVDSVGQKLGSVSHLPTLGWHFRVLDSPVVNAFAIPGGYIYITRGILAYLNSEAQLAGVLGHEIGHVTARHSAQQITRSEIAGVGLLAGAVFVGALRPYTGLASQGLGLLFLKYSRDNETQADELGVGYATRAGYDPREIPATYSMLKRVAERQGSDLPSFYSTHPDPGDREIRTSQLAHAAIAGGRRDLKIDAPRYRARIEGLIYGDDPRGGFFVANRFYHPDLGFEMIFPDGWKTVNQPSSVVAANQSLGGLMELSLQRSKDLTATPDRFVQSLLTDKKILDASGRTEQFRDFPAWIGQVTANGEGGKQVLIAGFVRFKPGQFLQVLGQTRSSGDVASEQILAAIRSIAILRDPERLNVTSDLLHVVTTDRSATFADIVSRLGPQALTPEETAILNNMRMTATIPAGTAVKIVRKGRHP
ncbi:MAG TPA: M48 family metalloprotease [Candidatus Limnocylindrales bacterium]|nr:M48 family metalloprotease [Candidatus Limnocylindrales bacterium]